MENHSDRPEIQDALTSGYGMSIRYSHTLNKNMMYVAIPMEKEGKVIGVVRVSKSISVIDEALASVKGKMVVSGIIIAILAAVTGIFVSRRVTVPVSEIIQGAKNFANGNLKYRLPAPDTEELRALTEAMEQMAEQLKNNLDALMLERNEQQAVLSSMIEGVIAVNAEENVLSMNTAAGKMLGVNPKEVKGMVIQETVRNTALQNYVRKTILEESPSEEVVMIEYSGAERYLQVHGAPLKESSGKKLGAVIVLNDVTQLRKLENIRREFVANVSHELRTPITSIKGFVETLLDGALQKPEEANRFLNVIASQVDRLNAIIEDLLLLSRTEYNAEKGEINMEEQNINPALKSAVQLCTVKAEEKSINLTLETEDNLNAKINMPLLEQAVSNLIDNAIKYSEQGKEVKIKAQKTSNIIVISVTDYGCGIEKEHLSRIFERFYRVDKARSRKLGGTGLGLSIVKHIAQAHGGKVSVDSTPGKGSTFKLELPAI